MQNYSSKSADFEEFLDRLNRAVADEFADDVPNRSDLITGTIVGLPRSGTTLLMQLLARSGQCGYPSNLMALYWRTPHAGATLQRHFQRSAEERDISLRSLGGRTDDPLEPHEFGYFWRAALGHTRNSLQPDGERVQADELQMKLDLTNEVFGQPTVYKNLLAVSHSDFYQNDLQRQKLILIHRNPLEVAASLLVLRRNLGMSIDDWFGTIPATPRSEFRDDVDKVTYQVRSLTEAYERTHLGASPSVKIVTYTELCDDPRATVGGILEFLGADDPDRGADALPDAVEKSSQLEFLRPAERRRIEKWLQET